MNTEWSLIDKIQGQFEVTIFGIYQYGEVPHLTVIEFTTPAYPGGFLNLRIHPQLTLRIALVGESRRHVGDVDLPKMVASTLYERPDCPCCPATPTPNRDQTHHINDPVSG